MKEIEKEELKQYILSKNENAEIIFINPQDLIFEENVKMNCWYCGKYANNWRCPPHLPNIDYVQMMREYTNGAFVYLKFRITSKDEYSCIRNDSSVMLHKLLLKLEKWMYERNMSNALSFIGGSCKLCKGGCGKDKCNNPYMSRTPLEAIGVNVIKSAKKYGLNIKFPTDQELIRVGLLLWQEENEL